MQNTSLESFYAAAAGVAGALIGLLFVAVSVARDRLGDDLRSGHEIPATAALTAFTNALCISLFGLIEGGDIAVAAAACGLAGLLFVAAGLARLARNRDWGAHNFLVLGLMAGAFAGELITGLSNRSDPSALGVQKTIAVLVVVCFLTGITRSWELIGGRQIGVVAELREYFKRPPGMRGGYSDRGESGRDSSSVTAERATVSWNRRG